MGYYRECGDRRSFAAQCERTEPGHCRAGTAKRQYFLLSEAALWADEQSDASGATGFLQHVGKRRFLGLFPERNGNVKAVDLGCRLADIDRRVDSGRNGPAALFGCLRGDALPPFALCAHLLVTRLDDTACGTQRYDPVYAEFRRLLDDQVHRRSFEQPLKQRDATGARWIKRSYDSSDGSVPLDQLQNRRELPASSVGDDDVVTRAESKNVTQVVDLGVSNRRGCPHDWCLSKESVDGHGESPMP